MLKQYLYINHTTKLTNTIHSLLLASWLKRKITKNMNRPGDWTCMTCHHLNFQRRDSCHRCGEHRIVVPLHDQRYGFSTLRGISGSSSPSHFSLFGSTPSPGPDVRPGDWYCHINNCGTHNFANRSTCFKCGTLKDELSGSGGSSVGGSSSGSSSRIGWKSGDWICSRLGCNEHNFASRTECFRCNAPRELFGRSWSSHS